MMSTLRLVPPASTKTADRSKEPLRSGGTALAAVRVMKVSNDNLVGRVVISGDGIAIGEIARLFVETTSWRVESLQVTLRKDSAERIGIRRSVFHSSTIEIATALVQSVGDAVVLSVALDALRAPEASSVKPSAPLH
jgi:sporulation protein YlmC with PRC-barrel domain